MNAELLASIFGASGRWVAYVSIVAIVGAAGSYVAVRGHTGEATAAIERRLLRLELGAALTLVAAHGWRLYAQTYSIFGIDESVTWEYVKIVVFETTWGAGWRWQLSAAIFAAVGLATARRVVGGRVALTLTAALAVVATLPLTGHAVSGDGAAWLSVVVQIGHVGAVGLWIGTLFVVMVILRPNAGRAFPAAIRAFSQLAIGAVSVLVATGLVTAVIYFESVSDLWTGVYGRTLLLKLLLFGAVAGLGAFNWRKLKPVLDQPNQVERLTRSAGAELLLASVVLVVTAVLVALPLIHD